MPTPTEILAGLTAIANEHVLVANGWHVVLAAAIVGLAVGWRPNSKTSGLLLSPLAVSVSVYAFAYGNPFNGIAFALLTMILVWSTRARPAPAVALPWLGATLIVFGSAYPHFLVSKPLVAFLAAAPTGLVPCPTLAVLIGFSLLRPQLFSKVWSRALVAYGLFYGLFGALRLGVWLDLGLIIGALGLLRATWPHAREQGLASISERALDPVERRRAS